MAGETAYIRVAITVRKDRKTGYMVERRDGYDLFINGKWHERYNLKRDALAAAKEMGCGVIEQESFHI